MRESPHDRYQRPGGVDDQEGVDMLERSAEPATEPQRNDDDGDRDESLDRMCWKALRRAANYGRLLPEGFRLIDVLHDLHPEWRAEW
jgi:hypothetical protein